MKIFYLKLCLLLSLTANSQCYVKDISVYTDSNLMIDVDGFLWAWGSNSSGELGITGTDITFNNRIQVGTDNDWKSVQLNNGSTLIIKNNGTLWGCGLNVYGTLGDGTNTSGSNIHQIGTDTWKEVSINQSRVIGIKTNGTLWNWGVNNTIPVQVGTSSDWKKAYVGNGFFLALKNNGTLWNWGQLGGGGCDGSNFIAQPIQVGIDNTWKDIRLSENVNLAIKENGTLWSKGNNYLGNMGVPTITCSNIFVQVGTDTDWDSFKESELQNGGYAFKINGTLWAWGNNSNGILGIGNNTAAIYYPTQVIGSEWRSIKAGNWISFGIKNDNSLWHVNSSSYQDYLSFQGLFTNMCSPLSTDQIVSEENSKISVFPNPVNNLLNISSNTTITKIKIINILGQITKELNGNNLSIDVSNLDKGFYIIEIISNEKTVTRKFLKR